MRVFRNLLALLVIIGVMTMPAVVMAAGSSPSKNPSSTSTDSSSGPTTQSVTQGYAADPTTQKGMIVMLVSKQPAKIAPLTYDSVTNMLGVVIDQNDATVTLSDQSNAGQVFVATFGRYNALVSTQNGPIKAGDYVTISALAGIGMKVDTNEPVVLGRAAGNFDGTSNVESTTKLKTSTGSSLNVAIGRIPVDISISHNPLQQTSAKGVPPALQKISDGIAQKQVGVARIYMGLAALIATLVVAIAVLYSGVRGGLVAIGRNPLAKKSIVGGIFRVILGGIIIFLVGLFGVYLILRL